MNSPEWCISKLSWLAKHLREIQELANFEAKAIRSYQQAHVDCSRFRCCKMNFNHTRCVGYMNTSYCCSSWKTVSYLHPSESGYPSLEWNQPLQQNTEHRRQLVLSLCCLGPGKTPQPMIVAAWMTQHHHLEWPSWGAPAHPPKRVNEAPELITMLRSAETAKPCLHYTCMFESMDIPAKPDSSVRQVKCSLLT